MILGSEAVSATLSLISHGNIQTTIQQDPSNIKTAYKLDKDNCKIDFSKNVTQIHNQIRGLSPYPTAWCHFKDGNNEWNIKIYEVKKELIEHEIEIGKVITTKKEIKIAVLGGFIHVLALQFPGKKKMQAYELLNGINFSENTHAF